MIKTIAYGVPKLRNANALDNLDENRFGYGEFREVILPDLADNEGQWCIHSRKLQHK